MQKHNPNKPTKLPIFGACFLCCHSLFLSSQVFQHLFVPYSSKTAYISTVKSPPPIIFFCFCSASNMTL